MLILGGFRRFRTTAANEFDAINAILARFLYQRPRILVADRFGNVAAFIEHLDLRATIEDLNSQRIDRGKSRHVENESTTPNTAGVASKL